MLFFQPRILNLYKVNRRASTPWLLRCTIYSQVYSLRPVETRSREVYGQLSSVQHLSHLLYVQRDCYSPPAVRHEDTRYSSSGWTRWKNEWTEIRVHSRLRLPTIDGQVLGKKSMIAQQTFLSLMYIHIYSHMYLLK